MTRDFAPGDVIVRRFANGSEHRRVVVAGDDGSVRTSRGKLRWRSVDADGRFTSGVQTAWWSPPDSFGARGDWWVERAPIDFTR